MSTLDVREVEFNACAVEVSVTEDMVWVRLADGREIAAPIIWYPRVSNATPEQRSRWELIGGGYGIHWEELDEDISVRGLMRLQ